MVLSYVASKIQDKKIISSSKKPFDSVQKLENCRFTTSPTKHVSHNICDGTFSPELQIGLINSFS